MAGLGISIINKYIFMKILNPRSARFNAKERERVEKREPPTPTRESDAIIGDEECKGKHKGKK